MSSVRDLTPPHLRCSLGACPGIYEREDGKIVIVGPWLSQEEASRYRVGPGETAIVVDRELLSGLTENR